MDKLELKERILKGENLHTEFKESLPDNETLAKSIVCFTNTDGGQLITGISDSGDIVGVRNLDEAMRKIDDIAFNRCEPSIGILQETVDMDGVKGSKDLIEQKVVNFILGQGINADKPHGKKLGGFIKQVKAFFMMKTLSLRPPLGTLTWATLELFWKII